MDVLDRFPDHAAFLAHPIGVDERPVERVGAAAFLDVHGGDGLAEDLDVLASLPDRLAHGLDGIGVQIGEVVEQGAFGVDVRNYDGLIALSDMRSGLWLFRMDGFKGWNGHDLGMANISSVQDYDNGPDGAPKRAASMPTTANAVARSTH